MSLIFEDGTGKSDAESYISVTDADTYHANLGNTAWAALATATKEQLLRKGTNYLLQKYRQSIKGVRLTVTQALDWPRAYVVIDVNTYVDTDIVPVEWKNATAELALKANSGELLTDQTQNIIREKVGPLETEFDQSSPQSTRYKSIDGILAPYLMGSPGSLKIKRT